jgi:NOL1/NOP2/fmu family ribosome biogenesis protein
MQIKEMSKEEIRKLENLLKKNYGARIKFKDKIFKTSEEKIWLISKEALEFDFSKVRVNSAGLYFGKLKRNEKIQLSVEGAQLVGKKARKNIAIIDEENLKKFLQGFDFSAQKLIDCDINNFILIKYGEDFVGTGILRENYIENILPKARRIFLEVKKV